jgi:hypothetical protein
MAVLPSLLVWLVLSMAVQPAVGAHGVFLVPAAQEPRQTTGYRWHVAEAITFVRPIRATIDPDSDEIKPMANVAVALALFWYSDRPGPDPAGP